MQVEEKLQDIRRDDGYTLYDLVNYADNSELDKPEDAKLLRTNPHIRMS